MSRTRRSRSEGSQRLGRAVAMGFLLASACASSPATPPKGESALAHREQPVASEDAAPPVTEVPSYLEPNYGEAGYAHVTEADMPWRIAIAYPRNSPKYGSRRDARNAALDGMRLWQTAIQEHVPWFEFEFVLEDPKAPVQIEWKRRTTGSAQGRAGYVCDVVDGKRRIGGRMEIAIRASPTSQPLGVPEVRLLVAHEFGHVLGLGHCLECDSAMNYAWHTQERILVTPTDMRTFLELLAEPNRCQGEAG